MAKGVRAGKAYVELFSDSTQLMKGLSKAQSMLSSWGAKIASIGAKITGAVSLGAMPAMFSTRVFASFDDAMRDVRAVTGATKEQFDALTAAAEKLGRETSFSAKQVAEGMGALGRMGFKPDQIEAAIPAVMDLSMATGTELATAAEIAANNMNVFGLSASDMTDVADILTATANGSAQTLTDLGESLKLAAPQGAAAGENIKTVAASLGILANMGMKGSMAGNALKKAYSQFAKTKVQDKLAKIGIRTTTDEGELRSMPEIMAEIGEAMAKMPSAKKLAFAEEIFDMRGALAGLNLGGKTEDLKKFLDMLENSRGTANRQSVEKDAGIGGSFRRLQSAAEGVAITFGRIIGDAMQPYVEAIGKVLSTLAEWLKAHKQAILTAGKFVLGIGAAGVALLAFGKALQLASLAIGVLHGVLAGVGAVFGFLRTVVIATAGAIKFLQGISITFTGVAGAIQMAVHGITGAFIALKTVLMALVAANPATILLAGLVALGAYALWASDLFTGLGDAVANAFGGGWEAMKETFQALKTTFSAGDMAASWQVALAGVKLAFAQFMQGFAPYWNKFCFIISETWEQMGDSILKIWNWVKGSVLSVFYSMMASATKAIGTVIGSAKKAWNWMKAITPGSGYTTEDAERDNAKIDDEVEAKADVYEEKSNAALRSIFENNRYIDQMAQQRTMNDSRNYWDQMAKDARDAMQTAVKAATEKAEEERKKQEATTLQVKPPKPKQMPKMPAKLSGLESLNRAGGSFNARSFKGGGNADWTLVKAIKESVKAIEKNTEADKEDEVFA